MFVGICVCVFNGMRVFVFKGVFVCVSVFAGVRVFGGVSVFVRTFPVLFLLMTVYGDAHTRRRNAAAEDIFGGYINAAQTAGVHIVEKLLFIRQQFIQRRHKHISRRAHSRLYIQNFHIASETVSNWLLYSFA